MIFPLGLFLSVILAFCVSSNSFGSILYGMKVKKNTLLLFVLIYILLMLFDLTIPFIEGKIVLNLAYLFSLLLFFKYFDKKFDWRIIISCIIVCGVHIFINFAPYISNYIVIMLSSYILPLLTVFLLLFITNNLKRGIEALAIGYFVSEIIMLFFRQPNNLNIGNIAGQNIFLLMVAAYCFLFWVKCRFFAMARNDIY